MATRARDGSTSTASTSTRLEAGTRAAPVSPYGWAATWSRPIRPLDAGGPLSLSALGACTCDCEPFHVGGNRRCGGRWVAPVCLNLNCEWPPVPPGIVHASASRAMCRHVKRVPTQHAWRGSASSAFFLFLFLGTTSLSAVCLDLDGGVARNLLYCILTVVGQCCCRHIIFVWSRSRSYQLFS